ncbi:MAG: hypothetical protein KA100_03455 [Rickettsiales bacterium]|nr:hypothetical protein [Rickettsiales bacterium]
MTEVSAATPSKKKNNFLTKFVLTLALVFFGYIGFNYWKSSLAKKILAQHEAQKFDNVESDIFDLSGSHDATKDENLAEMNVNELREKGAEFIYHLLLKNQAQITDLNTRLQTVQDELTKHKNRERIGKMILTYVELRQEIFAEKNYTNSLKNFETLAALDENLPSKVERLKGALPEFSNQEKLSKSFASLVPDLIVTKNNNPNPSLISKIRRNISKLVIIRRIDGKNNGEIDSSIVEIEKSLKEENYQEAMNLLLSLNQSYHDIIADFLDDLSVAIEVQKIDQEILTYLKSLT